jgi:hypothetical protein
MSEVVMDGLEYTFTDVIRLWQGSKSTWHYVSLPPDISDEIHTLSQYHQTKRRGWGAVKVIASITSSRAPSIPAPALTWQTSIFPAFDHKRYALFLKAEIRKQASVREGDAVTIQLKLQF